MKKLIVWILLFAGTSLFAQQKFEKELRVPESEVPARALDFAESLCPDSRLKWYKETGLSSKSFEAKTKYQGKKYSVEFSLNGELEDVEVEVKSKELSNSLLKSIDDQFDVDFQKHRLKKIQIQYSGTEPDVLQFFSQSLGIDRLQINYEVVVSAKKGETFGFYEYLFSSRGRLLKKSEIILKMTDNIIY
ncbi:hypothetical protein [Jiulongibacter sediminis]|uniref:Uncharacterized protein n=1 Tax=Jiulongibacter sediminis TaxID=1605367 RepID=A0A0P7BJL9_9BACT|nr:hypothetical protein [Jiulongibacter sediminis]KPM47401.1 hypothetical protein AFM12_14705 [Jiulongibacter sediminis]TBX22981.1 hypothetical protein TK44_14715 [Jiulongibacter sediminis]